MLESTLRLNLGLAGARGLEDGNGHQRFCGPGALTGRFLEQTVEGKSEKQEPAAWNYPRNLVELAARRRRFTGVCRS
jgi:hypothetical protein